jgi:quaternary ammonium compound-resistance protein SugE
MIAWIYLAIAILLEASWVIGLRFTGGWTKLLPSLFVVLAYGFGLVPLSLAGKTLPPSILYSIWVGGGIVIVSLVDILYFGEPASLAKVICILLILSGAIGLKWIAGGH